MQKLKKQKKIINQYSSKKRKMIIKVFATKVPVIYNLTRKSIRKD